MNLWQENIDLSSLTTFHVPARARFYYEAGNTEAAIEAIACARQENLPVLVLGGGSNILFTRDFEGLVLKLTERGIRYIEEDGRVLVRATAAEPWHEFVLDTLAHEAYGLENLSLIPGTVGAAPMQNIGAYGVELKDVLYRLTVWDSEIDNVVTLDPADCRFAYRDSVFKRNPGRYLILSVTFALSREPNLKLDYGEIHTELQARGIEHPTPKAVSDAIVAIRSRKLPDPTVLGNAGSFFKNPVVEPRLAERFLQENPNAPHWRMGDGRVKLAAGWLIDRCGLKGRKRGGASVYEKQALVLVNTGGASGADVRDLAAEVQAEVKARFGMELEAEPLIL